jgi:2-oxoisovalerate dehydrogenase E1 component
MLILIRQGKVSKWFSGIGQEAISVGVTAVLTRMNIHRCTLGVFTVVIFHCTVYSQWQGKANGFTKDRLSFHLEPTI